MCLAYMFCAGALAWRSSEKRRERMYACMGVLCVFVCVGGDGLVAGCVTELGLHPLPLLPPSASLALGPALCQFHLTLLMLLVFGMSSMFFILFHMLCV